MTDWRYRAKSNTHAFRLNSRAVLWQSFYYRCHYNYYYYYSVVIICYYIFIVPLICCHFFHSYEYFSRAIISLGSKYTFDTILPNYYFRFIIDTILTKRSYVIISMFNKPLKQFDRAVLFVRNNCNFFEVC